jgi:hypothetical protein
VADVQHIEASVGERDAITGTTPIGDALLEFIAG